MIKFKIAKGSHLLNLNEDNKEVETVALKIDELIRTLNALLVKSQDHHAINKRMLNLEVCPIFFLQKFMDSFSRTGSTMMCTTVTIFLYE